MALAEGTGMTKPPKPTPSEYAQELLNHIALQSGQQPAQVTGAPAVGVEPERGVGNASLASQRTSIPQYGQAQNLIQQFLLANESPWADSNFARAVTRKSKKYGIDPRLLVAIAGAETSLGKDPNAAPMSAHNAWGMGGPYKGGGFEYDTWGQGAESTAKNLADNYIHEGLNTIAEISGKWAPLGAANDPNNVNQHWTDNVSSYYKDLTNQKGGNPLFGVPKAKGLQELLYQHKLWDAGGGYYRDPDTEEAHMGHVHEASSNPRILLKSIRVGQNRFNLTGGSNPWFTGHPETTGHTDDSWHYKNFPGTFGPDNKQLGEAIDWTGRPEDLAGFARWVTNRYVGAGQYDYGSAAPGQSSNWARPATEQDVQNEQNAQAQMAGATGAMDSGIYSEFEPVMGRKKRRSKSADAVQQLIASMMNQQAGAGLQGLYS